MRVSSKTFFLAASTALLLSSTSAFAENFNRIASFPVIKNMAAGEDTKRESSPEIIAATPDGMTLVYTDSPLGSVGFIDITNPASPAPLGNLVVNGEPTSVAIIGGTAFVGVNTSESYTKPSGKLVAVDIAAKKIVGSCELGGQPDSIAAAKDGSFVSVAIENERDEDLNGGVIPQLPAGNLTMVGVKDGNVDCASTKWTDLTGFADIAPMDPEAEFVDINSLGETVVTMQENNHLAVVAADGKVLSHFSAGSVDLTDIDATDERGALIFNESQSARKREPDAVKWLDDNHFATANEGDYEGGSRGWTIFNKNGTVVYESGTSFERAIIEIGHYPDKRSDSKGVEPESIETAVFWRHANGFCWRRTCLHCGCL